MDIFTILQEAVIKGASDIHLAPNRPPMMRVKGEIQKIADLPPLTAEDSKSLIYGILYDDQKLKFEENLELDCSYFIPNLSRFRVNVHMQKDGVAAVLRVIQAKIPSPDDIGLEESIIEVTNLPRGLVLVTGPTGSGKSTTLACLIDIINRKRREHILTIEDPIEFVYENKNCIITQREIGSQSKSFANALRTALRQDPDVILVGEMRDLETISLALTVTETGHLVFGTLHTTDAPKTVDRIVDVFPPYQQQQIRTQLSVSLKAVICQTLLPTKDGAGRVAAREIMIVTPAIGNLIREGKTHQIYNAIDTGSKLGMKSMDRSLAQLVREGKISMEDAEAKANDVNMLSNFVHMQEPAGYIS
ncbi:MAG: type IV pilus twitching motility protein PilT [Candidatus Eremiobacteraeota bacterium]|nr:type IV pilus twitching motility protein PilT [Candidatus Eremiobacteraeota bacterium]